ncbi:PASTA domain-containing protein [Flavobacteriales bacterium]|nr:PASTA domain-containing protein [Flavobacteriales bacterium]
MGLLRFIFSKKFIVNLAIAGLLLAVSAVGLFFWLDSYTQHGITVEVPDFSGLKVDEIEAFTDTMDIDFEVIDSLYSTDFPRGTVAEQEPQAGLNVKRGRTIYLTVNALLPKQVTMPNVQNLSLRQAKAVLESVGLKLGELEYQPDIAENAVLFQNVDGETVMKGETVFAGTAVNLVLGLGLSNKKVPIPYLLYSKLEEATDRIHNSSLNLGTFKVDTPVTDTGLVRVYKQIPSFDENDLVPMGTSMILYLTEDTIAIDYDTTFYTTGQLPLDSVLMDSLNNEPDFNEGN